MQMPTDMFSR